MPDLAERVCHCCHHAPFLGRTRLKSECRANHVCLIPSALWEIALAFSFSRARKLFCSLHMLSAYLIICMDLPCPHGSAVITATKAPMPSMTINDVQIFRILFRRTSHKCFHGFETAMAPYLTIPFNCVIISVWLPIHFLTRSNQTSFGMALTLLVNIPGGQA